MQSKYLSAISVALFVVVIGLARLLPHPFGVTPLGAMALFSGAYIQHRYQWLLPLAALLIGDLVMGLYDGVVMLGVYAGFALCALIARYALKRGWNASKLGGIMVLNAVVFYLVSNLAMWYSTLSAYPMTPAGLVQCYINGLPFLAQTLLGDMLYTALIFGAAHLVESMGQANSPARHG